MSDSGDPSETQQPIAAPEAMAAFVEKWQKSGGSERSNYQLFLSELARLLDEPEPDPSQEENRHNDYVFERSVAFKHPDGSSTTGFIDLYKRGSFVLEAKQSSSKARSKFVETETLPGFDLAGDAVKGGTARRGTKGWDKAMRNARGQAEDYARALPTDHGWPPFLVVVDVGHCIELFADFSQQGKNYAQFPDRQSYRIYLDDLLEPEVQHRLKAVWSDPLSLDPTRISAEVTRDIAERLAKVARELEGKGHQPEAVAEYLMRCLFTMFAEDVKLLPEGAFTQLLADHKEDPKRFRLMLEDLWEKMNTGGFYSGFGEVLRQFNGGLFESPTSLELDGSQIHELWVAARKDWRDVEPAIFGTLLERALDKRDRHKLGAHYTPRAYVERLVIPTIIDPLTEDWRAVQVEAQKLIDARKHDDARDVVRAFHLSLTDTKVLDPACGTGNFLYVAMELMKRLEGEVLETLAELGETDYLAGLSSHTVDPHQFLGLEINPRAVAIAELVLWIGFIKWQIRTSGRAAIDEPVLKAFHNIKNQDAVLAYDKQELLRGDDGKPVTRWDGHTMKLHPVTGEEVPDEAARMELYTYENPRPATWPDADFIVGNPPFTGGKDMRAELGDGYAEACWKARKHIPGGADFVMHFWDKAAELVRPGAGKKGKPRRFGLITTNSITQTFSRRVIEHHMGQKKPIGLLMAIPDHPWLKSADKAAVRIAMTVGVPGAVVGQLKTVVREADLNTDQPVVELTTRVGSIRPNLKLGADLAKALPLIANSGLAGRGVVLHGAGFILTNSEAHSLIEKEKLKGGSIVRPYRNGRDLMQLPRGVHAIDLFGMIETEVREQFPSVYQHILTRVKPEREQNNREYRRKNWWLFGENIPQFREALQGLPRYFATPETAKHRVFVMLDGEVLPDNKLVCFALESFWQFATLSSRIHYNWFEANCALLEDRPVYVKTSCFDPFPFADPTAVQKAQLDALGERLDEFRKERLAEHPKLTMTALYNVLEKLRAGEALDDKDKLVHEQGLVSVLREIHDEIDAAVFDAYGWPHDLSDEQILERLVALNQERAAEERAGKVRWLRPDYQIPKFGKPAEQEQLAADLGTPVEAAAGKPKWPTKLPDQIRLVRATLVGEEAPIDAKALSRRFTGGRKRDARITELLDTLTELGDVQQDGERYFLPRD
ncbi:hypothetical protein NBRC116588_04470 [Pyruvatibacter sp. HU-CL02332]|uniref:class I SAM-dependent DNA methyltransferase n=1 Tax=Pyruvatibacter sp. HU-CL02332 TaxID=3127650 RepID=UPI0031089EEA